MMRNRFPESDDLLLDIDELAEVLGCSAGHARNLRWKGQGPRAIKLGRTVRFRVSDVRAWIEAQAEPAGEPVDSALPGPAGSPARGK